MSVSQARILVMGGQELCLLTAEIVMGWSLEGEWWVDGEGRPARRTSEWYPAVDPEAIEALERRIAELGLSLIYRSRLAEIAPWPAPDMEAEAVGAFSENRAKACCRAAILAVLQSADSILHST